MQISTFLDDAAVFPPGNTPLAKAVEDHIKRWDLPANKHVGPLVLPVKDIPAALNFAGPAAEKIAFAAVTPAGGLAEVEALVDKATIASVELKVTAEDTAAVDAQLEEAAAFRAAHPETSVWVELPAALVNDAMAQRLLAADLGLKFRTGGINPDLFPSPEELMHVLSTAVRAKLPFKLTAGLHRAMRYRDEETGFMHFGFLNIAAATQALRAGRSTEEAMALLNSDNLEDLRPAAEDEHWRESFATFGTCSVYGPLHTLNELDLVPADAVQGLEVTHY